MTPSRQNTDYNLHITDIVYESGFGSSTRLGSINKRSSHARHHTEFDAATMLKSMRRFDQAMMLDQPSRLKNDDSKFKITPCKVVLV